MNNFTTPEQQTTRQNSIKHLRLDAAKRDALSALGHFYLRQRRFDKALVLFSALHELEPQNIRVTLSLAWCWLQHDKPEHSLSFANKALGRHDRLGQAARQIYSSALLRLGRREEALRLASLGRERQQEEVA